MNDICGLKVLKAGREGTIVSYDNAGYVTVKFGGSEILEYQFPGAFLNGILEACGEGKDTLNLILDSYAAKSEKTENVAKLSQDDLLSVLHKHAFEGPIHTTNFSNFISIIKNGFLMSRSAAEMNQIGFEDAADHDVLDRTKDRIKDYVRFYYYFKTPTNYTAKYDRPVIMVFDELMMNCRDVLFCDGNAASEYSTVTSEMAVAKEFDWDTIFSRGPIDLNNYGKRLYIVRSRNAEFLYPEKVSTEYIKTIYFKDAATLNEAKTLLRKNISLFNCVVDAGKFENCGGTDD